MRIGIDIRELEKGKSTGIGRYLRHFLLFVKEFDKENNYVLFGNQKTDFSPLNENQELYIIPDTMTVIWDQVLLPKAIKKEKIDVLLVAGDIFDVNTPSSTALKTYYNFLTSLQNSSCKTNT